MLGRFWKSQDGNFAVMVAIASLPVMAAVGGAIDVANTYAKASRLQSALDASAVALGANYSPGMTAADLNEEGKNVFAANYFGENIKGTDILASGALSNLKVEIDPADDTMSVSSAIASPSFLRSFPDWKVSRSASVRVMPGQPACMMALNPSASAAIRLQGNTQVSLNGCVVAANSKATDSISRGGSATLKAECALTAGKTSGLSGSFAKLACGAPLEGQAVSHDPLRNVTPPTDGCSSKKPVPKGNPKTFTPGVYCNENLDGNITLTPGVYVLRNIQIKLTGGILVGHGVTIFLLDGSSLTMNGNHTIDLSPPTSGPYAGITIFQGRDNAQELKINGSSTSKISGFVYAPNAHIFFAGNSSSGSSDCVRLVGDTIEMTGTSTIQTDCKAQLGGRTMNVGRYLALVK